jgi:hypothetical protein
MALAGFRDSPAPSGRNVVAEPAQLENAARHVQDVELAVGVHRVDRPALQGGE